MRNEPTLMQTNGLMCTRDSIVSLLDDGMFVQQFVF